MYLLFFMCIIKFPIWNKNERFHKKWRQLESVVLPCFESWRFQWKFQPVRFLLLEKKNYVENIRKYFLNRIDTVSVDMISWSCHSICATSNLSREKQKWNYFYKQIIPLGSPHRPKCISIILNAIWSVCQVYNT